MPVPDNQGFPYWSEPQRRQVRQASRSADNFADARYTARLCSTVPATARRRWASRAKRAIQGESASGSGMPANTEGGVFRALSPMIA